ncbi:hypothetical protein NC652_023599 [Populus alba x Populus x berolinensis]|nr:hypothetical protein NC652_023599 [Populus alba x Populus x berolinensis]
MNSTQWSFLALLVLIQSLSHEFFLSLSIPSSVCMIGLQREQKLSKFLMVLCFCIALMSHHQAVFIARIGLDHGLKLRH